MKNLLVDRRAADNKGFAAIWVDGKSLNFCATIVLQFQADGMLFPKLQQALTLAVSAMDILSMTNIKDKK